MPNSNLLLSLLLLISLHTFVISYDMIWYTERKQFVAETMPTRNDSRLQMLILSSKMGTTTPAPISFEDAITQQVWDPKCNYTYLWDLIVVCAHIGRCNLDEELVFEPENDPANCADRGVVNETKYEKLFEKIEIFNKNDTKQLFVDYWEQNASGTAFMLNLYTIFFAKQRNIFDGQEKGVQEVLNSNFTKYDLDTLVNSDWIVSFQNQVNSVRFNIFNKLDKKWQFTQTWFNLTDVPMTKDRMDLVAGDLYYYRDEGMASTEFHRSWLANVTTMRVAVYEAQNFIIGRSKPLDYKVIDRHEYGWFRFNVTTAVLKWKNSSDDNLGFFLRITNEETGEEVRLRHAGFIMNSFATPQFTTYLIGYYQMRVFDVWNFEEFRQRQIRVKRGLAQSFCHLYQHMEPFENLNLKITDNLLDASSHFHFNYCWGDCHYGVLYDYEDGLHEDVDNSQYKTTNNAHIKRQLLDKLSYVSKWKIWRPYDFLHCVPASYLPGLFLYRDERGGLAIRVVKDLTAESCACG